MSGFLESYYNPWEIFFVGFDDFDSEITMRVVDDIRVCNWIPGEFTDICLSNSVVSELIEIAYCGVQVKFLTKFALSDVFIVEFLVILDLTRYLEFLSSKSVDDLFEVVLFEGVHLVCVTKCCLLKWCQCIRFKYAVVQRCHW